MTFLVTNCTAAEKNHYSHHKELVADNISRFVNFSPVSHNCCQKCLKMPININFIHCWQDLVMQMCSFSIFHPLRTPLFPGEKLSNSDKDMIFKINTFLITLIQTCHSWYQYQFDDIKTLKLLSFQILSSMGYSKLHNSCLLLFFIRSVKIG